MSVTRVSLAAVRAPRPHNTGATARLLVRSGAKAVLGTHAEVFGLAQPIVPAASSLFGPRGACSGGTSGPLFVSDTGHHRLLIWNRIPEADGAPADFLIGQADFNREGRNAKGDIGPATLNVPTGVAAGDGVLAVADAWNHRVLIWHGYPERSNRPAGVVLGQAGFTTGLANRGADACSADTLNWCYGVAIADGRLIVADTGNRRVLIWNRIPETNGAPADFVLGQRDFTTRDENGGEAAGAMGMRWPHGIAVARGMLFVSDAGNNRVMVYDAPSWPGPARPSRSHDRSPLEGRAGANVYRERHALTLPGRDDKNCTFVLGQADAASIDINRAAYYPAANAMSMPYGLAVRGKTLVVADTANSRILGFDLDSIAMGGDALNLAAQPDFTAKGDNRWGEPLRDSVCWPYGVAASGDTLIVADSGNNRVLLWDFSS